MKRALQAAANPLAKALIWNSGADPLVLDLDGVSQTDEPTALADHGIFAISLAGTVIDAETPHGTLLRSRGTFTRETGPPVAPPATARCTTQCSI